MKMTLPDWLRFSLFILSGSCGLDGQVESSEVSAHNVAQERNQSRADSVFNAMERGVSSDTYFESQLNPASDPTAAKKRDHCCSFLDPIWSKAHCGQVYDNDVASFFVCLGRIGGSFTITRGECRGIDQGGGCEKIYYW